jgi:hypothetical protein
MINFLESVGSNVVASVIVVVLGFITVKAWYWYTRGRLHRFFGTRTVRRVVIYPSRLWVPRGGSLGVDGARRRFEGVTIPNYEAEIIREFGALFADNPVIRWSGDALLRWSDIDVVVKVSPASKDDIEPSATLITIGSPGYNVVSETVEQEWASPVRFISDNSAMVVRKDGSPIRGIGVVQRVVHPATGQVAFYVAGPSEAGTEAAALRLTRDWKPLRKRWKRQAQQGDQFYEEV